MNQSKLGSFMLGFCGLNITWWVGERLFLTKNKKLGGGASVTKWSYFGVSEGCGIVIIDLPV
jgi:hypothetical protein